MDAGDVSTDVLSAMVDAQVCTAPSGLRRKLTELDSADRRRAFAQELAESKHADYHGDPQKAYGTWLVVLEGFARKCGMKVSRDQLVRLSAESGAEATERTIDTAVESHDCGALAFVHQASLWPFERRFAQEVSKRDFSGAEVTRRLWLDTFRHVQKECSRRLDRRSLIAVEATIGKLDRIVGLDDPTLIELRTKLLDALERKDHAAALSFVSAVSEREKALDARNAAAYEAKMRDLEAQVEKAKKDAEQQASARRTASRRGQQTGQPASSTAQDIKEGLDTANKALDTANKTMETVDTARRLFGF